MPYAANGQISQAPIKGGIAISSERYAELLSGVQAGKRIVINGNRAEALSSDKRTVYSTADGAPLEIYIDDDTPEGYTDTKRPTEHHNWVNGAWVEDEQAALEAWRKTASVTSRQGEQQLIIAGMDEQVEAAIDTIPDPLQRKLTWAWYRRAGTWERNNSEFIALGEALGLTEEQMDEQIRAAEQL